MARPRVFVSSTYYDLRHIRASLETFIKSLGYEPILSEKGEIAYAPNIALDESCYREAAGSDVLVLIIGGRYGAERSDSRSTLPHEFFDRYDSITKLEYKNAVENNVLVYILVDAQVYGEYQTFQKNKDNKDIKYAHVDSVNIFHLIEDILLQGRNNALSTFSKYAEIEDWLREQWAGLFREFLKRTSSQIGLTTLEQLKEQLKELTAAAERGARVPQMISFDTRGVADPSTLPLHIDFDAGIDDPRIFTPPLAHRRVLRGALEFGSIVDFGNSWASIGKHQFRNFSLRFKARFSNPQSEEAWIGIGFRSQHFFANFAHMAYLKKDGSIILVEPDESSPTLYVDTTLGKSETTDVTSDHEFRVFFDERNLRVRIDDFNKSFDVADLPKVLGAGLIRFQSFACWMALISVDIE